MYESNLIYLYVVCFPVFVFLYFVLFCFEGIMVGGAGQSCSAFILCSS